MLIESDSSGTEVARCHGTLLGLAVGDALGAPVEFRRRHTFEPVSDMIGGGYFKLPAGAWTDDTAMALCLADSLILHPEFSAADLLERFCRWAEHGENSSTGQSIGIGQNTLRSLGNFRRNGTLTASEVTNRSDGNGAVMRLSPVAIVYGLEIDQAMEIADRQSRTTHCSELSAAGCQLLAAILSDLIAGKEWAEARTRNPRRNWPEEIARIALGDWGTKHADEISSTGYVLHTLEAAIWAVDQTDTLEGALLLAVNLGDDADTVGAVTGQIAGARYGLDAIPARWMKILIAKDRLFEAARQLVKVRRSLAA